MSLSSYMPTRIFEKAVVERYSSNSRHRITDFIATRRFRMKKKREEIKKEREKKDYGDRLYPQRTLKEA